MRDDIAPAISPFSFLLSPLIPLRGLFLLRTSAIQASLIALGLASVLLSPFKKCFSNISNPPSPKRPSAPCPSSHSPAVPTLLPYSWDCSTWDNPLWQRIAIFICAARNQMPTKRLCVSFVRSEE